MNHPYLLTWLELASVALADYEFRKHVLEISDISENELENMTKTLDAFLDVEKERAAQ